MAAFSTCRVRTPSVRSGSPWARLLSLEFLMLTSHQQDQAPTVIDVVHETFLGLGPSRLSVQGDTGTALFRDVETCSVAPGLVVTSTPSGAHEINGEICGATVSGVAHPLPNSSRYGSVRMKVRMLARQDATSLDSARSEAELH